MKIKTKRRLTLACVFALGLSVAAGGAALGVLDANATTAPFAIDEGAAVRTDAPAGIRFETTIGGEAYETYKAQNATFGTVVMPQAMLGENTLTLGMENSLNVVAENWIEAKADDPLTVDVNERVMQFNAVIVGEYDETTKTYAGLPEELYGTKLVARSYVTVDGNTTYAEGTAVRSIAQVASLALADKSEDANYTEAEIEFMNEITNYVATTESNVLDDVKVNLAAETLNDTIALPEGCGEVYGVYLLPSGYEIDAENYTVDGNAVKFAEAYLKGFGYNSEFTLKINAENGCYSVKTSFYGEVAASNKLLGFDSSEEAQYISYENAAEWLPEFNGASGVVKMTMSNIWSGLMLQLPYTLEELSAKDWGYFDVRIYTTMDGDIFEDNWPSAKKDAWATVRLTKANVLTIFTDEATFYDRLINGNTRLFAFWNAGTFYVDYINFIENNTTGVFNFDEMDSDAELMNSNLASTGWEATFNGVNGVAKGTYTGAYSASLEFRAATTVENLQALSWEVLVVRVWFEQTEANATANNPDPVSANWNINGLGSGKRAQWVSLCISKVNLAAQFGTIDKFYEAFTSAKGASFTQVYNTAAASYYVDQILFTNYDRTMDFEAASEISFLRSATATEVKHLESATCDKGVTEDGVLSFNHGTTQYAGIKFQFNNWTGMTADDWDTMEIRIRILRGPENTNPGTDASFSTLYLDNDHTWTGSVSNGWSTLTMSKSNFAACSTWGSNLNNFWNALVGSDGARVLFESWYVYTQGGWTIQIDHISLLKTAE